MILTSDDVQSRLHERPFIPLRLVTTTGQQYDVHHPDLVLVGRRFLIIGTPSTENPAQAELVTRIPLIHLTEMRDLASPPHSNGSTS